MEYYEGYPAIPTIVNYEPDSQQKRCIDCFHRYKHITWRCKNPDAIKTYNTATPSRSNCEYWSPARTTLWFKIKKWMKSN